MSVKIFFLILVMLCSGLTVKHVFAEEGAKKEILLRLPLLSEKNAQIISISLDSVSGINKIEACYELRVLIIGYDGDRIKDESFFENLISSLEINTTIEKIYSSDIPKIRSKYRINLLRNMEKEIK